MVGKMEIKQILALPMLMRCQLNVSASAALHALLGIGPWMVQQ